MKFIGRWFEKILSHLKCRAFACGIKNSVINEIGQNGIYVEFEIIFIPNLTAGFVQLQSIVNVLEKEISPMVKLLLVVIKPPVCMKCYLDRFFGLFFLYFSVSSLASSRAQAITSSRVGPCSFNNSLSTPNFLTVVEVLFPLLFLKLLVI